MDAETVLNELRACRLTGLVGGINLQNAIDLAQYYSDSRIIDIDKVRLDDIKEYLKAKHCVLWQNWYVTDPKGLEDAAKWIQSLLIELYTGISSKQG